MASFILKGLVTNDGIDRLRNGNQRRRCSIREFKQIATAGPDTAAGSKFPQK